MRYGFFPGCSYKTAAGYKESVDAVNEALGIELVEIPDWNCCGATATFSEDEDAALALTGRLFALAREHGFNELVTVCNACYTTLRKGQKILKAHPEKLEKVNRRLADEGLTCDPALPVRHHLDVLAEDVPESVWAEKTGSDAPPWKVAAYYGCQLTRPWKESIAAERPTQLEQLLEKAGVSTVEHSARTLCCGASHAVPYQDACSPLIGRIISEIQQKGGDLITTLCPMCQFNLDSAQKNLQTPSVPVPFFTQILGLALGLPEERLGLDKLLVPLDMKQGQAS